MQAKTWTLESDLIYPHGKLTAKTLNGIDGYLLALQYKNAASLGKALGALGGTVYWLPPENDRAVIWMRLGAAHKLPHRFSDRLFYLAQFQKSETVVGKCEKCKQNVSQLFNSGRKKVLLTCLKCSPYKQGTKNAELAKFEAANVLAQRDNKFRKLRATRLDLEKAA